ncbi:MAG: 30S ribosomal protein S4 [Chitinophagaceae bacterium]|jgi:small subunit ribosomal protein S4|nr:MAG: 30S ribosomal protein S4 [Chitinophagaceae bacterium]
MARYTGPASKIARKFGEPIFGYDKSLERKNYPPGQHGVTKRRKVSSEYGIQLKEKQKAKYTYGLLERQFLKTFKKAASKKGVTGENLLQLLEARLDNTVFRLGFATTRRAARQLVSHKHVIVNGELVNIPSYSLKPGDVVSVRTKSKSLMAVTDAMSKNSKTYNWLQWNADNMEGIFTAYPQRESIPENINEQLIVELYSK